MFLEWQRYPRDANAHPWRTRLLHPAWALLIVAVLAAGTFTALAVGDRGAFDPESVGRLCRQVDRHVLRSAQPYASELSTKPHRTSKAPLEETVITCELSYGSPSGGHRAAIAVSIHTDIRNNKHEAIEAYRVGQEDWLAGTRIGALPDLGGQSAYLRLKRGDDYVDAVAVVLEENLVLTVDVSVSGERASAYRARYALGRITRHTLARLDA